MNISGEFRKHAAECRLMASFTRDPASRATWSRMAARWLRCAEVFESQSSTLHAGKRYRKLSGSERDAKAA